MFPDDDYLVSSKVNNELRKKRREIVRAVTTRISLSSQSALSSARKRSGGGGLATRHVRVQAQRELIRPGRRLTRTEGGRSCLVVGMNFVNFFCKYMPLRRLHVYDYIYLCLA